MTKKRHSEEYFGEARDYWWNADFLSLMAKRWNLSIARHILDAGCGVGHWGRLLAPFLHKDCKVIGVDREADWVMAATEKARQMNLEQQYRYQCGDVTKLDFPDASFDFVTCQTVLIHVADPQALIREFIRVLKPGGVLAVAEPNNIANVLVFSSTNFSDPIDSVLDCVRFHLTLQRGKAALKEGHNSIGDLLPGYFANAGLAEVSAYISDKATPMFPPYDRPEQRAVIAQLAEFEKNETCLGGKDESLRYFTAGGGTASEFARLWQKMITNDRGEFRKSIDDSSYHTAGGCMTYLVSGIKVE